MSGFVDHVGDHNPLITQRKLHPLSPLTPAHLKRLCGTCVHFAGDLRGSDVLECPKLRVAVHARKSASKCRRWVRK